MECVVLAVNEVLVYNIKYEEGHFGVRGYAGGLGACRRVLMVLRVAGASGAGGVD